MLLLSNGIEIYAVCMDIHMDMFNEHCSNSAGTSILFDKLINYIVKKTQISIDRKNEWANEW